MPPKRRSAGATAKSNQATLAFHGASNKVTKPGVRAQNAKKNLDAVSTPKATKEIIPDVADISTSEATEPTNAEAAIIEQTEQVIEPSSPEEDAARRITDAKIKNYWKAKENERRAPRVHQETLSMHEKILREFDISAQYGPCTGIARLKRWKRAHRLGLSPPIEVLAVLLKEQEGKDKISVQRSYVDELLNSRNVAAEIEV